MSETSQLPHVVIIGGGFGGLRAAKQLKRANVRVTLIDRHNHHLFQPLLYQVATAGMMAESIAVPIRSVLSTQPNATVRMGEVSRIDLASRRVELADGEALSYDYLVVAAGARTHYFGNDAWMQHTFGLKSVADAYGIRRRVLTAFEAAEREADEARRRELLTFTVIGGGPTGVELAGALSELSRAIVNRDFRRVKPADVQVILLEAAPALLAAFHPNLRDNARVELGRLGVQVRLGAKVTDITAEGVALGDDFVRSQLVVWAAGVSPEPLVASIHGVTATTRGFIPVLSDCSIEGYPEAFAVGDIAAFVPAGTDPNKGPARPLPGVAPVAMQQGVHVAKMIRADLAKKPRQTFRYVDKGNMATIGKSRAVLEVGKLRLRGLIAWLAWLAVHVFYLIGFRNRAMVMFEWGWSYLTNHRGARLIALEASSADAAQRAAAPERKGPQHDAPVPSGAGTGDSRDRAKGGWTQNVPGTTTG